MLVSASTKSNPCYQAYEDDGYRKWVLENINEKSAREMRSLKNLMIEIGKYEGMASCSRLVNDLCTMPPLQHQLPQQGQATWLSLSTRLMAHDQRAT